MMTGTYSYGIVALSFLVAALAAYTATGITRVLAQRHSRPSLTWLIAGALALGSGIWTVHFIGMLAFGIRMPFTYDWPVAVLSMAIAIAVSAFVVRTASRRSASPTAIGAGGILLGAGIAAMHYTGMAAMRMDGRIVYEPFIVAASVGISVIAATAAVSIIYSIAHSGSEGPNGLRTRAVAAAVTALAMFGMHFTGMTAARFEANPGAALLEVPASNTSLSISVAIAALLILGVTQLSIFFDLRMTAERQRHREAQRRALHLNELLDHSSNEILVVDLDSLGIVDANQRCCESLGYALEELTSMSLVDIVENAAAASLRGHIASLVENDERHLRFESAHVRADGSAYPVRVNLEMSSRDGAEYLLVFATDITARKKLLAELDVAREFDAIGRLTAGVVREIDGPAVQVADNLRFLNQAMSEALDLIDALSALHLAASKGQLTPERIEAVGDMLKAVDPCYLAEEVPLAVHRSLDAMSRISAIVRALKDFSYPDGDELELTDINKAVRNTVLVASSEWKYVTALQTDLEPDLPLVRCRPREVGQAVLTLIVNAAHAIERRLKANTDAPTRIDIRTRSRGHVIEIVVSDTGAGIPISLGQRIFEPGFSASGAPGASGQGLAIAYDTIVDRHGGSIGYTSVEGEGTTFTIALPVDAVHETASSTADVAA